MFFIRTSLLIFILLGSTYKFADAFPAIPDNARVDTEVNILKNREYQLYTVEEFIDRQDGSIQIRAKDEFPDSLEESQVVNYYRIKELPMKNRNYSDFVVLYNQQLGCKKKRTINWLLKDMTYTLSLLYESPDLNLSNLKNDRTAIGPSALLRLFYANSHLLKLNMKAYDIIRLTEMYFFQATVNLEDNSRVAKLICLLPVATVMDDVNVVVGKTLLSDLKTQYHPAVLSVVILDKGDAHVGKNPQELYDVINDETDKLVIAYYLIQERSLSKHLGLKYGRLNEKNPFTLPEGKGCGAIGAHDLFFVPVVQFSGIFETSYSRHYIAYDDLTKHLRVDTIGEYKMIYDLKERRVTLISDPDSFIEDDEQKQHNVESISHEDKTHCSQSSITGSDDEEGLYNVRDIEQVLGLHKLASLMYLGTVILEDGSHCLMFEREITGYRQIPIIAKMNMNVKVQYNDRIFVVYYFVDDLLISQNNIEFFNDPTAYQSMWLKRMELTSIGALSKLSVLNAQVTFNEFSWSLESISEDTRDRESKILHPVRTFDTYECKSIHDQTKLEFVLKEVDKSVFDLKKAESTWDRNRLSNVVSNQIESFEEAIMLFIHTQCRISRSLINKFEVIETQPTSSSSAFESDQKFYLVKAILLMPMNYNFDRNLIGWIKSIDSVSFEKYGRFVKNSPSMSVTECSLYLATLFYNRNRITMVYCPNAGCGYLDNPELINMEKNSKSIQNSINTCDVYVQTKVLDPSKFIGDRFTSSSIQRSLNGSQMQLDIQDLSQESQSNTFRGIVVKTALIKGLSLDFLGHAIRYSVCFSQNTNFKQEKPFGIDITVLKLERPHSLIYCHKACHLDANCQTYSYSKDLNECILTNIPSKYFLEPNIDGSIEIIGLQQSEDCNLYEPNSLHLYQASNIIMFNSPSLLDSPYNSDKRYYITNAKLPDCATLCHSNELNVAKRIQCQKFIYFPMNSICAIEDNQSYLLETRDKLSNISPVDKTKHFTEVVGNNNWFAMNQYHEYYRDYSQYYIIKDWIKIEHSEKGQEVKMSGQATDNPKSINQDIEHDISGQLTLYSLEKEDCLRECTIINPNCVMVDYCFNNIRGMPTRYCSMYTVRSPLLINPSKLELEEGDKQQDILSDSTPLTNLERLYYRPNNFKLNAVKDYGCTHYYLAGDNLALKQQLASAHLYSHQGSLEIVSEIVNKDLEDSNEYLESIERLRRPVADSIGLLKITLSLLFGISAGCIISLVISTSIIPRNSLVNTISWNNFSLSNLRDRFNNYKRERFGRTQRSVSQVGLEVELEVIES